MPAPSAAIWKKLAEYSRSLANGARDPQNQTDLSEIARRYEALAKRAATQKAGTED